MFRGQERLVEYHDHGYDPDTNAQEIDWHFCDPDMKDVELTQDEEDAIYLHLCELSADDSDYDLGL